MRLRTAEASNDRRSVVVQNRLALHHCLFHTQQQFKTLRFHDRRLARDCERQVETLAAYHWIADVGLMLDRILYESA